MGWGQSKESGATEEPQNEEKPIKRRVGEENVEQSERATQGSIGSTQSQTRDLHRPLAIVETSVDNETEKIGVPINFTTTLALPIRGSGETTTSHDKKQENSVPWSCLEIAPPPVQPVDINLRQPEATTTPPAIGTVSESHYEEQAVEVEEKKLLIVTDTLLLSGPSEVTAETFREDKETLKEDSLQGPRAQDNSSYVSKKPVHKKRHTRTRCHGE